MALTHILNISSTLIHHQDHPSATVSNPGKVTRHTLNNVGPSSPSSQCRPRTLTLSCQSAEKHALDKPKPQIRGVWACQHSKQPYVIAARNNKRITSTSIALFDFSISAPYCHIFPHPNAPSISNQPNAYIPSQTFIASCTCGTGASPLISASTRAGQIAAHRNKRKKENDQ